MSWCLIFTACDSGTSSKPDSSQVSVEDEGKTSTDGDPIGSSSGNLNSFKAYSYSDRAFPDDNVWNTNISKAEVDPNSDKYITSMGKTGTLHADFGTIWAGLKLGIPVNVVQANQPKVPTSFLYPESDKGPYPIPANAIIQHSQD